MFVHMLDKFVEENYSVDPTTETYYQEITTNLQKADDRITTLEQEREIFIAWLEAIVEWEEVDADVQAEIDLYLNPPEPEE